MPVRPDETAGCIVGLSHGLQLEPRACVHALYRHAAAVRRRVALSPATPPPIEPLTVVGVNAFRR